MKGSALILLILLVLGLGILITSQRLTIFNPGPEGINVVVYGVHYRGEWSSIEDYSTWIHRGWEVELREKMAYAEIINYTMGIEDHSYTCTAMFCGDSDPTDIQVRFSIPAITDIDEEIEFEATNKLPNGSVEYVVKKGRIIDAEFYIEINSVPGTGYGGVENLDIWFMVEGVSWYKYLEDPQAPEGYRLVSRTGVIIPLKSYVVEVKPWAWVNEKNPDEVITNYPDDEAKDNVWIYPSAEGDVLDLRSEPSYSVSLNPPDIRDRQDLLEFVSEWSPDYRLNREKWYTYISIRYIEPHLTFNWLGQLDKAYFPSTAMKVHVVALAVGEFKYLWTEEEAKEHEYGWSWIGTIKIDFPSLDDLLENPWFWLGLGSILLIIVIILLLLTPAGAALAAAIAARRGTSKTSLALLGVLLIGIATVLQMIIDWYQSYAYGIPMPRVIQGLVLLAGLLALTGAILGAKGTQKKYKK
mgnify:CR=1 FL=1